MQTVQELIDALSQLPPDAMVSFKVSHTVDLVPYIPGEMKKEPKKGKKK